MCVHVEWASQVALMVKNLAAYAGHVRDTGLLTGSGRSPRERHGNPLQYSCLENPRDREARQATVHRVAKSKTYWGYSKLTRMRVHIERTSPRTRGKRTLEEPLSRKWFNPPLKRVVCFLLNPPGCLSVPISLLINLLNYFLFLWWNSFPEGRKARQHWGPGFKLWSEFEPRSLVKPLQPPHSTPEDGNMTFNSLQMPLPVMYYAHFSFNCHRSAHCQNIFFLYFICAPFLWV